MKYVVYYWSRYGNGKKIVDYLSEILKKNSHDVEVLRTDEADPANVPEGDFYVFSAPAEAFSVQRDMKGFMKKLEGVDGKRYGLINTHGMKRNWLGKMEKILSKKNMEIVAKVDFKVGDGVKTGDGLPDDWKNSINDFSSKIM